MNNKISSMQLSLFYILVFCGLYLGVSDIILMEKSGHDVLIAMILGSIIGLIPLFLCLKIGSYMPEYNIYKKNIKLFGKVFGTIMNSIAIFVYYLLFLSSFHVIVNFIISKYLQDTSFILVSLLIIVTTIIICFKGLETILRFSSMSFIVSTILMIFIELSLSKYVDFKNILPFFASKNSVMNILKGAIYHASSSSLLICLFLTINKNKIKDKEKLNKRMIISYIIASLIPILVMFFIISCFGFKTGSLFRYPEYILLKKIGISSSDLHLENLLSFRWIFYMLALTNICLYGIIEFFDCYSKNIKLNRILICILCFLSIFIANKIFYSVSNSVIMVKNYYLYFFTLPIMITLIIIYIRCLFIKKDNNKN